MNRTHKIFLIALLVVGNSHKLAITASQTKAMLACVSQEMLNRLTEEERKPAICIHKALDQHNVHGITLTEFLKALAELEEIANPNGELTFAGPALLGASTEEIVAQIRTQIDRFQLYVQEMFAQLSNEELTLSVNETRAWELFNNFLDLKNKNVPLWRDLVDEITGYLQGTKKSTLQELSAGLLSTRDNSGMFGKLHLKNTLMGLNHAIPASYQAKIKKCGMKLKDRIRL